MRALIACLALLATVTAAAAQKTTTFRDASGRSTGTATTDSRGSTTFRDSSGRLTGTASTQGNSTTFRDASGRLTGTSGR